MPRRTKIVATLGPATDNEDVLKNLLLAGVDVVRINCSHGSTQQQINRIIAVKQIAKDNKIDVAVLLDLQGPKIRIAKFQNNSVTLANNALFILDADLDEAAGNEHQVGIDYKNLPKELKSGDKLLLDDGRISLEVVSTAHNKINCRVLHGGVLTNNKGINLFGGGLSGEVLSDKDKEDIKLASQLEVDYVALSFVRCKADIDEAKKLLLAHGSSAGIIAKIERAEALTALDEIIIASNGVMVARGDLGVEIGDAELPAVQKKIINRARALDRVVITATQMMESMIDNITPTRAEVFDVANAVIDGTDAVMLSAETATGKHPVEVVQAMSRICIGSEKYPATTSSKHRIECTFERADEAVAMAAMYVANHLDVKAIIALTETGATALWMSRIRSGIPIYALSRFEQTILKMKLFRGVYPLRFDITKQKRDSVNSNAIAELIKLDVVKKGDWIVMARGDYIGVEGGCNTLKILKVGDVN